MTVLSPSAFAQEYGLLPVTGGNTTPQTPSVIYTTIQNDRWDLIAWRIYGDISLMQILIGENPQIPIDCQLAQGLQIYCPVLTIPAPAPTTPWTP